jgi:hypothetical protein
MGRQAELSRSQRHGLKLAVQLAIVGAIVAAIVLTQRLRGAPLAHDLRERLLMFTPVRALETAAATVEVLVIVWLVSAIARGRAGTAHARELSVRPFAALGRLPTIVALGGIVALAAWFRILLTRAETIPHVFGDELIYTDLAKSIALHGKPLVRGELDIGHSVLYPLLLSPAYGFAANGAGAYVAVKTINAVALSLTAVPTYFLARRVASHGWSLGVAALVVVEPWTAYAALTMTESLFLPAFTAFALILVWMLEQPTVRGQLLVLAGLAVLVGIRPQALVFAASVVAAIGIKGLLDGRLAAEIERHAVVLGGLAVALLAGVIALVAGVPVPAGSAKQLLTVHYSPLALVKWTLWNLAVYELAMGVIALAVFPLALRGLLRRSASVAERSVGTVALALSAGVVLSVAVLSASRYGLGILHERNVFYATPLVLICLVHWLTHGLERPRLLAAATAAGAVALAATLPQHLVSITNNVDSPTSAWLQQLKNQVPDMPLRAWTILIAGVAAAAFLFMRRPPAAVLSTLLAFVAIAWPLDYSGPFTPKQDQALAWVDRSLPAGATATLIHVGLSRSDQPCAQDADYEQQQLVTWTEFFNTRVDRVLHVFAPAPGLLPSSQLAVGPGGVTLENGRPLTTRYVVLDSRQPIVGRRLARFDLPRLSSPLQQGASLSLWRASAPVTFRPHAQPLPPRADGRAC